ncbi:N-acetylglucosamine-6-phosphate deacetylase [Ornithinimicrobium sp. Y1694]|uniref:N-acetylglucosamine-6-phosphate deacetylase n=1 Tax=Ornithinimicrobium sp. Y1694 TaxID=3418590 RepID=UPI003CF5C7D7
MSTVTSVEGFRPRGRLVSSPAMLQPDGTLAAGWVEELGGMITDLGTGAAPGPVEVDTAYLIPGFVDVHCHGGGGHTFATTDPREVAAAATLHRRHGTTHVMASLVTASIDELERQVQCLVPLVDNATVAGIHLEGPWLSPLHRGAHDPELLTQPRLEDVERLLMAADGKLTMVTIAPELPGAMEAIDLLTRSGVVVAIGHTDADGVQFRAAVEAGARQVTHLCNAMRPIHHRSPGPIVAALADDRVAVELIADGVHVHPEVLELLSRSARSQVLLVTDAMAAAGSADGAYQLGSLAVDVVDGVARLAGGGSIAGSTLTMDRAVRTAVASGVPVGRALDAATRLPAIAMGWEAGELKVGSDDWLALDADLRVVDLA